MKVNGLTELITRLKKCMVLRLAKYLVRMADICIQDFWEWGGGGSLGIRQLGRPRTGERYH
jgi:hypothetical protein